MRTAGALFFACILLVAGGCADIPKYEKLAGLMVCSYIATRNISDFKMSAIPVLAPEEFFMNL